MNTLALLLLLSGPIDSAPARESDAARNSKNGKVQGTVGGAPVLVTYGRPKAKGRDVWKDIVKPGEVWRAGADEATVVAFDKDVLVEGQKLPAGAYAFFVITGKDQWTLVFNKEAKQWGAYKYDEKKDALRVKVTPKAVPATEELTFKIDGSTMVLAWDKQSAAFKVEAAK